MTSRDEPVPGSADAMARDPRLGRATSEQLTVAALDRIAHHDGSIHAFLAVDAAGAIAAARAADAALAAGRDLGPLQGIPFAIKDIYDVQGQPTTCQSRVQSGHVAVSNAAVVDRLQAAGAVLIGKLDTFEYALGGPSRDLPKPAARNPWNTAHETGGSSSGSGAAIAAGYVPLALGTDTTGSIRGPAAWCGAVGLKPTFGRVSRRGVFPLASSLDHCGPLARSVRDAATCLQVIAGHDAADPQSANRPVPDYTSSLEQGVGGMTVGVPRSFFEGDPALSDDQRQALARSEALFRAAGARIVDVALPGYRVFMACARLIMAAEAFAIHRDNLRGRLGAFGEIAARRFAIGAGIAEADHADCLRLKTQLTKQVQAALAPCQMMLTPIALAAAPPLATSSRPVVWPLQASPWNLTGHPAIAVPMGLGRGGLPLSVQLVGPHWSEATVLRGARVLERSSGWAGVRLPL